MIGWMGAMKSGILMAGDEMGVHSDSDSDYVRHTQHSNGYIDAKQRLQTYLGQ